MLPRAFLTGSRKTQVRHLGAYCFFAVEGQRVTDTGQRGTSQRSGHRIVVSRSCLKIYLVSFVLSFFLAILFNRWIDKGVMCSEETRCTTFQSRLFWFEAVCIVSWEYTQEITFIWKFNKSLKINNVPNSRQVWISRMYVKLTCDYILWWCRPHSFFPCHPHWGFSCPEYVP